MAQDFQPGQEVEVSNAGRKNGFRGIVVEEIKPGLFTVQHGGDGDEPLCYYAHELRSLLQETQAKRI